MKKILIVFAAAALFLSLAGCSRTSVAGITVVPTDRQDSDAEPQGVGTHHAEIEIQDYGTVTVELDGDAAPVTVQNFMDLANDGFYDGLTFHRIIPGFMIQGGCPDGTGMGGPGWHIKGEFQKNGWENPIRHSRGVISMARAMDPNSAGSQFFIMHADAPHLDGSYAAFGRVVNGMDVVDEIAAVATGYGDKPQQPVVIETMRVVEE